MRDCSEQAVVQRKPTKHTVLLLLSTWLWIVVLELEPH